MKNILLLLLCLAVGFALLFASYRLDNDNADTEALKALAAPYENELVALRQQLTVTENKIEEKHDVAAVLIAYYAPDADKIPNIKGFYPILISKTPMDGEGDPASWNGAWSAGCCYLDKAIDTLPNRQDLMQKGADTFLRNAELVSAGFDGTSYTLPYVILDNADFNMPDQLELLKKMPGTLVFVFDMNVLSTYHTENYLSQLTEAADAGILRFTRLEDEKAFLYAAHLAEEVRREEFETGKQELEARIEALEAEINAIYRDWNRQHGQK